MLIFVGGAAALGIAFLVVTAVAVVAVVRLLLCPKAVGHNHCKSTVITNWFINNCCC